MGKVVLKQGESYKLKFSKQFCHAVGHKGFRSFSKNMNDEDRIQATFVGTVPTEKGLRNVFYNDKMESSRSYIMFDADKVDYIVTE